MTGESNAGASLVGRIVEDLWDIADRSAEPDRGALLNAIHTLQACQRLLARAGYDQSAA